MKKIIVAILIMFVLAGCFGNSWDYVKKEQVTRASLP